MKNKDMIQENLFDLKGKKRWKAFGERLLFIVTDWRIYLMFGMLTYLIYLMIILTKQQELLASFG